MTISNTKRILRRIQGNVFASDKFHALTNNKTLSAIHNKQIPQSWQIIHFKTYPRFKKIYLNDIKIQDSQLRNLLIKRRSIRHFTGAPISKSQLYYFLSSSAGIIYRDEPINNSRRPYPSAGARYPLEIYAILQNCQNIEKGLYHYNVKENVLELLLKKDFGEWLAKVSGGQAWLKESAVVFIITGVLDRTRIKYGDRGYRYVLLEAGHLGQNISLLATELGMGSCALGGYIDSEVNKLLDIKLQKEVTIYIIAVGNI